MARTGSSLDTGDKFPEITLKLLSGKEITLPKIQNEGYTAFLIYRGGWCSTCRYQLADFQSLQERLENEGIFLIAASADPFEKAEETVKKLGLTYALAYDMNAEKISNLIGCFFDNEKKFIHATGFLIRADGTVDTACYSTGSIGRLPAKHVLNLVKYYKIESKKKKQIPKMERSRQC